MSTTVTDGRHLAGTGVAAIGPTTLIRSETSGSLADLTMASADAKNRAAHRTSWVQDGAAAPVGLLPAKDVLLGQIEQAPNDGLMSIWTYAPEIGESHSFTALRTPGRVVPRGESTQLAVDLSTWQRSMNHGGVIVGRITLDYPTLADLADDLACAWEAHVEVVAVVGRIPSGSELLKNTNRVILFSYDELVQVETNNNADLEVRSVAAGTVLDAASVSALQVANQGLAIVMLVTMPTRRDMLLHARRKSGYWPSFRAGLPIEHGVRVELAGLPGLQLPSEYLERGLREMIGPDGFAEAMAWWRSTILPSPRRARLFRAPESDTALRTDLPGGLGTLISTPEHQGRIFGAAAGCLFELPDFGITALCGAIRSGATTVGDLSDAGLLDPLLLLGVLRRETEMTD